MVARIPYSDAMSPYLVAPSVDANAHTGAYRRERAGRRNGLEVGENQRVEATSAIHTPTIAKPTVAAAIGRQR